MTKTNNTLSFYIIAYWHDPRFKKRTGGLVRMFELADNLIKLGHKVTLMVPRLGNPREQTISKVIEIPFLDINFIRPISFHLSLSLVLLLTIRKTDLLYIRQMNSFLPFILAKLFNIPSFYEIPNDPYLAYEHSGRIRRFFEKIMDVLSIRLSDKVVVLSEWSKQRLHKLGGVPADKITVLPSGTDTTLFRPMDKVHCCKVIGLDPSFYVGFVGTFFDYQGIDSLIEASPGVLRIFKNTRFLLVGDGPMMQSWKNKVSQAGLGDAFIFTGQVPYARVPLYIGAMDICVAPHHKGTNQASPVKLFDYLACGRPIVASDIEVVREIVNGSESSILVDPDNPMELAKGIVTLLENDEDRRRRGYLGRILAESKYDRKVITTNLLKEIRTMPQRKH